MALCFVLLIIILFLLQKIGSGTEKYIPGFWSASDQFKDQADLDEMLIYFDEGQGYMYKGYVVIASRGNTLFNNTTNFRITPSGYFKSDEFILETEEEIPGMAKKMIMTICPNEGHMTLKCAGDTPLIYARMFKDNQRSAMTVLKWGVDGDDSSNSESADDIPPSTE
jgi:hypothetical protein